MLLEAAEPVGDTPSDVTGRIAAVGKEDAK